MNYSVKELLGRVDLKIDGLYEKLDAKADQTEVVLLKSDVDALKSFQSKAVGALVVIGALASAGAIHLFI